MGPFWSQIQGDTHRKQKPETDIMPGHHWLLLASLYFLQGFPSGLLVHALPPILRSSGVSLEILGFVKLLALPWVFKFLWAPFVDRFRFRKAGPHRGWILAMQAGVVFCLAALFFVDLSHLGDSGLILLFTIIFLLNLFCATQDIATDGLAVKLLPPKLRGLGNSVQVSGYKLGLLGGGALILWGIDTVGWQNTVTGMLLIVVIGMIPVLYFNENRTLPFVDYPLAKDDENREPISIRWLFHAFTHFARRPGIPFWLLTMGLYKLGDSLGSAMIKPMFVDIGLSYTQIAHITVLGTITSLFATVVGGVLYARFGPKTCLLAFGFFQGIGLGLYALIEPGTPEPLVTAISIFEQCADGMSTVALFALMMTHCRPEHESSDYTLQACLQVMVAGFGGVFGGFFAQWAGYTLHFTLAMVVSWVCLGVVLRWFQLRPENKLEQNATGH